ncbi:aminomethyl-transferring glycine dehydrogenase subunit GcvPA [Desulfofundulus thermosubterraneus]|uniref:Probable glycine dehydrogenase (decarboxylating) subunit 1 n=1 Tax=Desulfofundulus thermosubterraneus DSM 16057 TaxID=1121432 RepID=A0A1M6KWU7_9FIRM|nr:aminomethyl-transferring glycine dehydrogenase subunit GcvPA [Desulfofundulus thermosubterraneus]SHJ63356.1 glycine dehydrogenase (decarboxylating) alpha subunit [Desulfofundulus thermosubterraneus DSM 16057]
MRYIPNTPAERQKMLADIGVGSVEELFADIPEQVRLKRELDLPEALSEPELVRHMENLAGKNGDTGRYTCFLGGGYYDHYIPAVVPALLARSEFYTAYTPYQAEISQGTLAAIYEFQTMICELTGMDVANASMYDGATALAEAAAVATGVTGRRRVVVARTVHPEYRQVLNTYLEPRGVELVKLPFADGITVTDNLDRYIDRQTAAVLVQQPNFFGCLEDVHSLEQAARGAGALFIVSADPISLGLLKPPGEYGADIVVGEGQSLGLPLSFGGPGFGYFAAREKFLRRIPGRMVGATTDVHGRRGFVLTLQAREQHIRREKATSNICSNQALCALAATIYLSAMGPAGLRQVAGLCAQKAAYAKKRLAGVKGITVAFTAPSFKEFVLKSEYPVTRVQEVLLRRGLVAGPDLGRFYPELSNHLLVAVTEKRTKEEIDRLAEALEEVAG